MTYYLRLLGVGLLMIGAMLICRGYESYLKRRLAELRGLVSLISHAEGKISGFLSYGGELWKDFRDDALEKCGLLQGLRGGESLHSAFASSAGKMSISRSISERLTAEFSKLGRRDKEGELSLLSSIREGVSAELDAEGGEAEKNIKVARALLFGGALAIGIMVM